MKTTKKRCPQCATRKDLTAFNKHANSKDGYQSWCRSCSRIYNAKRTAKTTQPTTLTATVVKTHRRRSTRKVVRISPTLFHLIEVLAAKKNQQPTQYIENILKTNIEDKILDVVSEL